MRLGPSDADMSGKNRLYVCTVRCVLCLIQTYNVNSYNILGLH